MNESYHHVEYNSSPPTNNDDNAVTTTRTTNKKRRVRFSETSSRHYASYLENTSHDEKREIFRRLWYSREDFDRFLSERVDTLRKFDEGRPCEHSFCLRGLEHFESTDMHRLIATKQYIHRQMVFVEQERQRNSNSSIIDARRILMQTSETSRWASKRAQQRAAMDAIDVYGTTSETTTTPQQQQRLASLPIAQSLSTSTNTAMSSLSTTMPTNTAMSSTSETPPQALKRLASLPIAQSLSSTAMSSLSATMPLRSLPLFPQGSTSAATSLTRSLLRSSSLTNNSSPSVDIIKLKQMNAQLVQSYLKSNNKLREAIQASARRDSLFGSCHRDSLAHHHAHVRTTAFPSDSCCAPPPTKKLKTEVVERRDSLAMLCQAAVERRDSLSAIMRR